MAIFSGYNIGNKRFNKNPKNTTNKKPVGFLLPHYEISHRDGQSELILQKVMFYIIPYYKCWEIEGGVWDD